MQALAHYDNNEFEESLKVFDNISDTSKILFNCGVIHATLGEHEKAVCEINLFGKCFADLHRSNATSAVFSSTNIWLSRISNKVFPIS